MSVLDKRPPSFGCQVLWAHPGLLRVGMQHIQLPFVQPGQSQPDTAAEYLRFGSAKQFPSTLHCRVEFFRCQNQYKEPECDVFEIRQASLVSRWVSWPLAGVSSTFLGNAFVCPVQPPCHVASFRLAVWSSFPVIAACTPNDIVPMTCNAQTASHAISEWPSMGVICLRQFWFVAVHVCCS